MKINKLCKTAECQDKIREIIANPNNSIIFILGIPFIFALIWILFEKDPYLYYFMIIGPLVPLFIYGYCTEHRTTSAIFGFLLYPLIFLQTDILSFILDFGFQQALNHLTWHRILNLILGIWPLSIIHALIGFLVVHRKQTYLFAAFLLFVVHAILFYFAID
ncbi:MAG: hypothetical protein RBT65_08340 [Methanolobus sp.]|nr:hypothetical protein [Methanolobus sp.]